MAQAFSYWPADQSESLVELTVGGLLKEGQARHPERAALIWSAEGVERRSWTYDELATQAERAARALSERFRPGDHLAVWAPNCVEWVVLEFGAALAGLVLVTVNPALRRDEFNYVLTQSRAVGLVLVDEHRDNPMREHLDSLRSSLSDLREVIRLEEWSDFVDSASGGALANVDPASPAQIQYTSGTTGFPKGAMLTHRGVVNNARLQGQRLELGPDDVCLNYMPMFHTGGCVNGTLIPVTAGATHVLMSRFDAVSALDVVQAERCTSIGGVPTMYLAMMESDSFDQRDLASLRVGWAGGATVSPDLVNDIQNAFGIRLSIVFGQTETSPTITQTRLNDSLMDKAESVGQALPQTEVKIINPDTGVTLPIDTVGELCTRGYLTMLGYFDLADATAATIDSDGWLHTGDLCQMDARGYCYVSGRIKDMIIRGGENIYPQEVEEVFDSHPAVAQTSVVGIPDARWGEQPIAFVRLLEGHDASAEELIAFGRAHLAPHKVPRRWQFLEEFPMTPSGKIQKHVLRDSLAAVVDGRDDGRAKSSPGQRVAANKPGAL
jgi:fatty-acyl-CoA synthase